ncbi:MAG: helix-turn-helix domain-containing protein [Candidatus Portnoybacteria bacterium]|nr:helix-turn-helix domain-containing protein [Candidatus Portnoybacteria bacterium]
MVDPNEVYTPKETRELLKISSSTLKRLIKGGLIRTNKVGGQYRFLGHEILRLVSPQLDEKATNVYQKIKKRVVKAFEE